jgi:energy-coupling factor transporter ATP-binding protein EcfA2
VDTLPKVFTPAAPVSDVRLLRGREQTREDIERAMVRKGATIVLYGERGVGKSSIAKIVAQFASGKPCYYSASAEDTFETICSAVLQFYDVGWTPDTRETQSSRGRQATLHLGNLRAEASATDARGQREAQLEKGRLTAQQFAGRLPERAGLIIIDEFERLPNPRDRAAFADLIKKLSDNESPATLMLVGIADNIDELLVAHESAQRSIVEIKVERLTDTAIREIVDTGIGALGIEIDAPVTEQIVAFSARFPYYTHLLCEGVVQALIGRCSADGGTSRFQVGMADLNASIGHAIRNAQRSIIRAYEEAVRSIQGSPRFKYCLYAIASWPEEPVAYGDICRWVGSLQHAPNGEVNVSHQLKRLESIGVIHRVASGYYAFRNPMLKAYVILKARADTPDVELQAIDSQLDVVRKRFERVKERLGSQGPGA